MLLNLRDRNEISRVQYVYEKMTSSDITAPLYRIVSFVDRQQERNAQVLSVDPKALTDRVNPSQWVAEDTTCSAVNTGRPVVWQCQHFARNVCISP
jgi:hypothetical protein